MRTTDDRSGGTRGQGGKRAPVKTLPKPSKVPAASVELGFGPHLVFDAKGCPRERLADLDGLYALLDQLPDRIGMTKIMPPYVFRHGEPSQPGAGASGFVLIAESHISIHTFPNEGRMSADVFSCEPFDPGIVVAELRRAFQPKRVHWKLLDRGREFPKLVGDSRTTVLRDRLEIVRNLGLGVSR